MSEAGLGYVGLWGFDCLSRGHAEYGHVSSGVIKSNCLCQTKRWYKMGEKNNNPGQVGVSPPTSPLSLKNREKDAMKKRRQNLKKFHNNNIHCQILSL